MSRLIKKDSTNITTYVFIQDSTDGSAETAVDVTILDLQYVRFAAAPSAKVDATALVATDSAHADNKAIEIDATDQPGLYRVDWPDAAFATGVSGVVLTVKGTGFQPVNIEIQLVNFDPEDGVRMGLTALPNAAPAAAGGLVISAAGGLDLDAKLANTNEVTAARMGALTDWINGGRLDLLLDAIKAVSDVLPNSGALTDIDTGINNLETRLTAARGGYLDELEAAKIPADIDTLLTRITDARMGALTDWIDGGRLDLLLDAVPTTAMRGTDNGATAAKLLAYIQLLARSDVAIETDNATELTAINADGGSGAGDFSSQTDSGEGVRDNQGTPQTADNNTILAHADYGLAMLVRSTTPANKLDVSSTGEAGLDYDNIKDATGAHTLTNITVPVVTTVGTTTTNTDMVSEPPTAAAVVDEWETQSQSDPTGFHVNVKEVDGTAQTANDNGADINTILTDTNELQTDLIDGGRLDLLIDAILADVTGIDGDAMRGTNDAALASVLGALADAAAAGDPTNADTLMQYLKQVINILAGTTGIGTFPAEAGPANAVSLAEVIRAIHVDVTGLNGDAIRGTNNGATAANLATAQSDLDLLTGPDGATLASIQPNYAPNVVIPDVAGTAATQAEVGTEIDDALNNDTHAEPGQGAPPASPTIRQMVHYLYKQFTNKEEQTASQYSLYNSAGDTVDQKSTVSDDATTATKGEIVSGA